jgi:hypothetical protein
MKRLLIGALALLLAALDTHAEKIYRCVGDDGETTYSQIPCEYNTGVHQTGNDRCLGTYGKWYPRGNERCAATSQRAFPAPQRRAASARSPQAGANNDLPDVGSWKTHHGNWSVARHYSHVHCVNLHPKDYSLQAACMRNANEGFIEMHGDYGLPSAIALEAKTQCAERHPEDFAIQAACMRNQSEGYRQMRR